MKLNSLTELVTKTISLAQERFANPETLRQPQFCLSFEMNSSGIIGAKYTPILNNIGFDSIDYLCDGKGGLVLPWTYEDTYRYLLKLEDSSPINSNLIIDYFENWNAIIGGVKPGQIFFTQDNSVDIKTPVIAGGTRKGKDIIYSKMNRNWDTTNLVHNLDDCPLCNKSQMDEVISGNLKSFTNSNTPWKYHKMIIPTKKFYQDNKQDTLYLTDSNHLAELLGLAQSLYLDYTNSSRLTLGIHRGILGGQNLAHFHAHLVDRLSKY